MSAALSFEVTRLSVPAYLVRVEDENGENVCAFNVTPESGSRLVCGLVHALCALAAWLNRFSETLVVEGMRGEITCPAQWFAAVAEHFPSAKHVDYERGSPQLGNVTKRRVTLR